MPGNWNAGNRWKDQWWGAQWWAAPGSTPPSGGTGYDPDLVNEYLLQMAQRNRHDAREEEERQRIVLATLEAAEEWS